MPSASCEGGARAREIVVSKGGGREESADPWRAGATATEAPCGSGREASEAPCGSDEDDDNGTASGGAARPGTGERGA